MYSVVYIVVCVAELLYAYTVVYLVVCVEEPLLNIKDNSALTKKVTSTNKSKSMTDEYSEYEHTIEYSTQYEYNTH